MMSCPFKCENDFPLAYKANLHRLSSWLHPLNNICLFLWCINSYWCELDNWRTIILFWFRHEKFNTMYKDIASPVNMLCNIKVSITDAELNEHWHCYYIQGISVLQHIDFMFQVGDRWNCPMDNLVIQLA